MRAGDRATNADPVSTGCNWVSEPDAPRPSFDRAHRPDVPFRARIHRFAPSRQGPVRPPDSPPNPRQVHITPSLCLDTDAGHEVTTDSRSFQLPFGDVPAAVFIAMRTTGALCHAWDLAQATGQPTDLDPELSAETLIAAKALVQSAMRGRNRPYGDEQPCPSGGTGADHLPPIWVLDWTGGTSCNS